MLTPDLGVLRKGRGSRGEGGGVSGGKWRVSGFCANEQATTGPDRALGTPHAPARDMRRVAYPRNGGVLRHDPTQANLNPNRSLHQAGACGEPANPLARSAKPQSRSRLNLSVGRRSIVCKMNGWRTEKPRRRGADPRNATGRRIHVRREG